MFSDFKKGKEIFTFKGLLMVSEQKIDENQEFFFPQLAFEVFSSSQMLVKFLSFHSFIPLVKSLLSVYGNCLEDDNV